MTNRVSVTIDADDHSRGGLAALRTNLRRLRNDARRAGSNIDFNVHLDDNTARTDLRRLQRALRGQNVNISTRLVAPRPPPSTLMRRLRARFGRGVEVPLRVSRRGLAPALGPFRMLGRLIGGTMSDGIAQGISNAFRMATPVGMAIFAAIIAGSVSLIGAALAGLLVTALGGAFVAVAAVSASKSKEVQRNWAAELKKLKKHFQEVGEPLIPVLHKAVHLMGRMADKAAPIFRDAMVEAAPAVDSLIQKLMEGFRRFGKEAFKPIMKAWNVFAPVFGDVFSDFMEDLGSNFADLGGVVRDHSYEIEQALRLVFGAVSGLVEVVEFLTNAWITGLKATLGAINLLVNYGLIPLARIALDSFGAILAGAASAFGWMPGIGGKLKSASKSFATFRARTMADLEKIGYSAAHANERIDLFNKKRKLTADIKSWKASLAEALKKLKKTVNAKSRAKLTANIKDLERKILKAKRQLNSIDGKIANTYVNTHYTSTSQGGHPTQRRRASGGNIGAAATGGVRSNMTLVGEQGPEIVDLAPGSHVRSNSDSRNLTAGGEGGPLTVNLIVDSKTIARATFDSWRELVRNKGGIAKVVS